VARFAARPRLAPALLALPLVAVLVFAYAVPVAIMAGLGFFATDPTGRVLPELTLGHFFKFFGDNWYFFVLVRSIRIALFVTVLTVVLGYAVAYFLAFYRSRLFELYLVLVIAPILIGNVVRAYGWRFLMGENGVVNGLLIRLGAIDGPIPFLYTEHGIVIADSSVLLPIVVMILLGVLSRIDGAYIEAAKSLGAGRWRAFWHVTLPLSLPGVAAASVICFTLALGTFETAVFIGGKRVQMIAPLVYEQIGVVFNWPFGAAMSLIILAISLVGIALNDRLMRGGAR
jgi:putative spermidine/putrescine transport system permease protein